MIKNHIHVKIFKEMVYFPNFAENAQIVGFCATSVLSNITKLKT